LHMAIERGRVEVVELLLLCERFTEVDCKNKVRVMLNVYGV
jgi:hypothetical protein